jgi:DNA-binding GntR family transcriptional regulator
LRPASLQYSFDQACGFMDLVRAACGRAKLEVLYSRLKPAERFAEPLAIRPEDPLLAMQKLFLTALLPLIYAVNMVPLGLVI